MITGPDVVCSPFEWQINLEKLLNTYLSESDRIHERFTMPRLSGVTTFIKHYAANNSPYYKIGIVSPNERASVDLMRQMKADRGYYKHFNSENLFYFNLYGFENGMKGLRLDIVLLDLNDSDPFRNRQPLSFTLATTKMIVEFNQEIPY